MRLTIHGSLGDEVALTALPREIKRYYPHEMITVDCRFPELFENNPYLEGSEESGRLISLPLAPDNKIGNLVHAYGKCAGIRILDDTPEVFIGDEPNEFSQEAGHRLVVSFDSWAGWEKRRWPHEMFRELVRKIHETFGNDVYTVEVGNSTQDCHGRRRPDERLGCMLNLVDKTSLKDVASVLRASELFVGNDSGLFHLSAAVGTPQIVIFSVPWYARAYRTTYPLFNPNNQCTDVEGDCPHIPHCLSQIAVDDALKMMHVALGKRK